MTRPDALSIPRKLGLLAVTLILAFSVFNFSTRAWSINGNIRVDGGLISGTTADGVTSYKGIPFAAPPVGELRWKAPQPVVAWEGVRPCNDFGPECPQAPYPQASLYYLARMLVAGEEPLYVLRRLTRAAVEDIGLADPNALLQCLAAKEMYDFLGSPEGEIGIVQACLYLATAPKSNATYMAQKKAWSSAKETGSLMPPMHILNAPTKLMKNVGYGKGYAYDHDADEAFSGQVYWPEGMDQQTFYEPTDRGFEARVRERLDYWNERRKELQRNADDEG